MRRVLAQGLVSLGVLLGGPLALAAPAAKTPTVQLATSRPPPPKPSKDPAAAPAGVYALDGRHVSIQLRVAHGGGFSYSVFRMGAAAGVINWDPAALQNSKANVRIETKSLETNVPGFADELTGPNFLNAALFPDASFVSTDIKQTGPTTAQITGNFTLHGVTHPLVLDTELVGAGQGLSGPTLGFHAQGKFHRLDFGVGPVSPVIGDEIEVIIDLEFNKTG